MEAARQGDRAAFTALIDRHRPLLIALCRRALREHVLVEDAMQEAIQQALLNLNRLRDPARFGPRLAGIGLNVCRRMIHQRTSDWTWKAMSGGYRASLLVSDEPDPVAIVMANEEAARVRPAASGDARLPRGADRGRGSGGARD